MSEADEAPRVITWEQLGRAFDEFERQQLQSAMEYAGTHTFDLERIEHVYERCLAKSDREVAILIFSLIDDCFKELVRKRMSPTFKFKPDDFLEGDGPLATASARFRLAASFMWISPHTFAAIDLLRKIRNAFAHSIDVESFATAPVAGYLASMERLEETFLVTLLGENYHDKLLRRPTPRDLFIVRSVSILHRLLVEWSTIDTSIKFRLPPSKILELGTDRIPKPHVDLFVLSFRVMATLIRPKKSTSEPPEA